MIKASRRHDGVVSIKLILCIVRWFLTVPAAIFGWYIGVIAALTIQKLCEWLCPIKYVVSGMCYAPWSSFVSNVGLTVGSVICGSLVVLLPALTAPSHRVMVARVAYTAGLVSSAYWIAQGFWVPVVLAAIAGALTLWHTHMPSSNQTG